MERWVGKVAVVTGASSGIGAAIAENLVNNGMKVVGLARRLDRLQELEKSLSGKKGKFYARKCDVAKEEEILSAFKWVEENLNGVHVLVNNAGVASKMTFLEAAETKIWQQIYDINIVGLQICSREAIKSMRLHKFDGQIINISSIVAHMSSPIPGSVPYFASKKAVNTISEGLRVELNLTKSKIKVTTICPGLVKTEIIDIIGFKMPKDVAGLESEDIASTVEYVLSLPPNVLITDMVVRHVVDASQEILEYNKSLGTM